MGVIKILAEQCAMTEVVTPTSYREAVIKSDNQGAVATKVARKGLG
jgi:hypothetical protein